MSETYRIEDKSEVMMNDEPMTTFKFYRRIGEAFVYDGTYLAFGHALSDEECFAATEEGE